MLTMEFVYFRVSGLLIVFFFLYIYTQRVQYIQIYIILLYVNNDTSHRPQSQHNI